MQLCLWHIKKAIEARLTNNKKPQQIHYDAKAVQQLFPFVDLSFKPSLNEGKIIFCPKEFRSLRWELMNKHLHQHPLIPTTDEKFLSSASIWKLAVEEIYNFCKKHSLPWLWVYLWNKWYNSERWILWLRASCDDKLSIFKTNMFVEAHWKVLKRDFLYKFFRSQLDLVVFIIMKQGISVEESRFQQLFAVEREKAEWRKAFKKEWRKLSTRTINHDTYLTDTDNWICGCLAFLTSQFLICKHLVRQKEVVEIEFFDKVHRHQQYPFLGFSSQICNLRQFISQTTPNFELIEDEESQIYEELYN